MCQPISNRILSAAMIRNKILKPKFHGSDTFIQNTVSVELSAELPWILGRVAADDDLCVPGWIEFHQLTCIDNSPTSITAFCPILPAPAHEYDTLWTVIIRCRIIAQHLCEQWTIITIDEALCSKATELLWARLGGFGNIFREHCRQYGKV